MTRPVNESTKCTQFIRTIPLENFRLPGDGRKWKQAARSRQNLLIRISTWANGDGTFVGENGIDYSPSEKTIAKHVDPRSYYRLSNDLKELGWLSWTRNQTHYGRRRFSIHLDNHLPDSPKTPAIFDDNHLPDSSQTPDLFAGTPDTVTGDNTCHRANYPSYLAPASMRTENQRTFADVAVDSNGGAQAQTDAVDGDTPPAGTAVPAVSPTSPEGHLPSNPTTGGLEGTLRASGEKQQHPEIEFSVEPVTAETRRRIRKQSQQEFSRTASATFSKLPQPVKDQVKHLRDRCRVDWDYWRTHDEDGDPLDEEDYRFGDYPAPQYDHQLKLAKLLGTYPESQILGAWKKFLNRRRGLAYLEFVWANFFLEFEDHVDAEQPVADGVA